MVPTRNGQTAVGFSPPKGMQSVKLITLHRSIGWRSTNPPSGDPPNRVEVDVKATSTLRLGQLLVQLRQAEGQLLRLLDQRVAIGAEHVGQVVAGLLVDGDAER